MKIFLFSETTYCKGNSTVCCSPSELMFMGRRKLSAQPSAMPGDPNFLNLIQLPLQDHRRALSKGSAAFPPSCRRILPRRTAHSPALSTARQLVVGSGIGKRVNPQHLLLHILQWPTPSKPRRVARKCSQLHRQGKPPGACFLPPLPSP